MAFSIVEVADHHGRDTFCCGRDDLIDQFCREHALEHNRNDYTRVKVAIGDDDRVIGFYTLAAHNLRSNKKLLQMLDGHEKECPAFHLQMVAVCKEQERKVLGPVLIDDAFQSAARAANDVGARVVYLQAASASLIPYYKSFGFRVIDAKTYTMYVPIDYVRDAIRPPSAEEGLAASAA